MRREKGAPKAPKCAEQTFKLIHRAGLRCILPKPFFDLLRGLQIAEEREEPRWLPEVTSGQNGLQCARG